MSSRQRFNLVWISALALSVAALIVTPASTAIVPSSDLPDRSAWLAMLDEIPATCSQPVNQAWIDKVNSIQWVAYSAPNPNQQGGYYRPAVDEITADLRALKKAGFTGLITYGSSGIMGKQFLTVAESLGYQGIIMGIWNPSGQDELDNAANAASVPIVLGYSIGNEGLGDSRSRYTVLDLCSAISDLRARTGKPVATSEDIEVYYRWPQILSVGDWVFAISHPYWHFTKYAPDAIQWEQDQYAALQDRTRQFIFFKEVGLPTSGAAGLSEANQDEYYRGLAKTDVRFAYFEGFDQPSKTGASVEPHWGIFHSDLTPKLLAWNLMGYHTFNGAGTRAWIETCSGRHTSNCKIQAAGTMLSVGDDRGDQHYSGYISFNTSALPDEAILTSARLKVKLAGVAGQNPINNRRGLVLDICTPPMSDAMRAQANGIQAAMRCQSNLGQFGQTPNAGWYSVELSPAAFGSINLKGSTQFRLRITGQPEGAGSRAYLQFYTADADESDSPVLLVKYRMP